MSSIRRTILRLGSKRANEI